MSDADSISASHRLSDLEPVLDRISDACLIFDASLGCTYANAAAATLCGQPADHLLGRSYRDILPGFSEPGLCAAYQRAWDAQQAVTHDHYLSERQCWHIHRIYPAATGLTVMIHAPSTAEHTLKQAMAHYEALLDAIPDLIFVFDPEGKIIRHYARGGDLYTAPEHFVGQRIEAVLPADLAATVRAKIAAIHQGAPLTSLTYDLDLPHGRQDFEARFVPAGPEEVLVIVRNVTAERQAQARLAQSEAQFRALFEGAPVAIIVHDPETGAIVDANPVAWQSHGFDSLAALQREGFWLAPPFSMTDGMAKIRQTLAEGPQAFEWQKRRPDGTRFWEQVALRALTLGGQTRVLATSFDITARKTAELALAQSTTQLTERLKEMHCLASVSKLIESPHINLPTLLQDVANLLPPAMQFPALAGARICFDDQTYTAGAPDTAGEYIARSLSPAGVPRGEIAVYYAEHRPFLEEEHDLIEMIRRSLELFITRIQATEALRESELRYKRLFESSPVAMFSVEPSGHFIANRAFVDLTGYSPDQLGGLPELLAVAFTDPATQQALMRRWQAPETGRLLPATFEAHLRTSAGEGKDVVMSVMAAPGFNVTALLDVTERKRHLHAIEAQNQTLREITWTQSHVVRAPLTQIMGLTNLLQDESFAGFGPDSPFPDKASALQLLLRATRQLDLAIRDVSEKAYAVSAPPVEDPAPLTPLPVPSPQHFDLLLVDDDPIVQKLHAFSVRQHRLHPAPQQFLNGRTALQYLTQHIAQGSFFLVFLDIHMPDMNGWDFLDALATQPWRSQVRVVILTSSISQADRDKARTYASVIAFCPKPLRPETIAYLKEDPALRDLWPAAGEAR